MTLFNSHKLIIVSSALVTTYQLKGEKSVNIISGLGITAVSGDYCNWLFNVEYNPQKHQIINNDYWFMNLDNSNIDPESFRSMVEPVFCALREISSRTKKDRLTPDSFKLFNKTIGLFNQKTYNENKWLECYDKLIRIDKYSEEAVYYICNYFRRDGNWWKDSGNFESLLKLRRLDRDGIKWIDIFANKIKAEKNRGFAVGNKIHVNDGKQREY